MKGINDILQSYKTYEGDETEQEYVQVVLSAFKHLEESVKGEEAHRILINKICRLTITPNKLMMYIYRRATSGDLESVKRALEKLKNEDRELFAGFLSRNENKKAAWAAHLRRARAIYKEERRNALSGG